MQKELPDCLPFEEFKIRVSKSKRPVSRHIETIYRYVDDFDGKVRLFWNELRRSEADGKPIETYLSSVGREISEDGEELDDRSEYELTEKALSRIKPLINAGTQAYDYNRNCPITTQALFTIEKVAETPFKVEVKIKPTE